MVSNSGADKPPRGVADRRSASNGKLMRGRDVSWPRLEPQKLREASLRDYSIRFVLGGAVSVLAALLSQLVTQRFGGIFTAFPAILLASLTLIGQHDGQEASAEDAEGGVAGAIALALMTTFLSLTLVRVSGAMALGIGLILWLVLATGIYGLAVRAGWLRSYERDDQRNPDDGNATQSR